MKSVRYVFLAAMTIHIPCYGADMKTYVFPEEVHTKKLSDKEAAKAFTHPEKLILQSSESQSLITTRLTLSQT